MLSILFLFLSKPLFANGIGFALQAILYFAITRFVRTRSYLWEIVCSRVGLFLFLESFCQTMYNLNDYYTHFHIALIAKAVIMAIISVPLFNLWIILPGLLIKHKNETDTINSKGKKSKTASEPISRTEPTANHSEVTNRILRSLRRIDKDCAVAQSI